MSENDKSLVLLIEFAGRKILLCSDIENAAQKEILRQHPDLRADIVVAPHHGSTRTTDPGFLEALGAEVLVFSCGPREYESLQEAARIGPAEHFYTPEHGAVTVCIDQDGRTEIRTAARRD